MPAEEGIHASVKAIQDMEAACARFARALSERLPEIEREMRRVSEALDYRRKQLNREVIELRETISSAREDDDVGRERRRLEEAEEGLAAVQRRIRKVEEACADYRSPARNAERIATERILRMREYLSGATSALGAYLLKSYGDSEIAGAAAGHSIPPPSSHRSDIDRITECVAAAPDAQTAHAMVALPTEEHGRLTLACDGLTKNQADEANSFIGSLLHRKLSPEAPCSVIATEGRGGYRPAEAIAAVRIDSVSNTVHELAHHIECSNPHLLESCRKFILSRTKPGEVAKRLSKLTGDEKYKPAEVAIEDEWVARGGSVYCGKFYGPSVSEATGTEVLSMGLERLYRSPIGFARNDPEYFKFLLSILRT